MFSVDGSSYNMICGLAGLGNVTWYDEEDNIVVSGNELSYSANDTIHHKIFSCSVLNMNKSDYIVHYIKFVINGNF